MHRVLGGLAPAAPGCRRIEVAPRPGGGIASASTAHRDPADDPHWLPPTFAPDR